MPTVRSVVEQLIYGPSDGSMMRHRVIFDRLILLWPARCMDHGCRYLKSTVGATVHDTLVVCLIVVGSFYHRTIS